MLSTAARVRPRDGGAEHRPAEDVTMRWKGNRESEQGCHWTVSNGICAAANGQTEGGD